MSELLNKNCTIQFRNEDGAVQFEWFYKKERIQETNKIGYR